jgi:hypothetical protein
MWAAVPCSAAPEPSAGSKSWQLDFRFRDPERITVRLPGDDADTTFWYVLFTVVNNTGEDVSFFPSADLVTDTLQVVRAGDDISPSVYEAIAARHAKEFPFFASPAKITGPLLQGEDNHRTSALVFRTFDPSASKFTLYVGGLSGEITRVINPGFDEKEPESESNARYFVLRRTLAVSYDLPGDVSTRGVAAPVRRHREWVMR